jgi:hypothetical protein
MRLGNPTQPRRFDAERNQGATDRGESEQSAWHKDWMFAPVGGNELDVPLRWAILVIGPVGFHERQAGPAQLDREHIVAGTRLS